MGWKIKIEIPANTVKLSSGLLIPRGLFAQGVWMQRIGLILLDGPSDCSYRIADESDSADSSGRSGRDDSRQDDGGTRLIHGSHRGKSRTRPPPRASNRIFLTNCSSCHSADSTGASGRGLIRSPPVLKDQLGELIGT